MADKTLMLKEIAAHTGIDSNTLARYLLERDLKEYMKPQGEPARYPETSLPKFEALAEMIEKKIVKPKTAMAMLTDKLGADYETDSETNEKGVFEKRIRNTPSISDSAPPDDDIPPSSPDNALILHSILATLIEGQQQQAELITTLSRALPAPETDRMPPEDRFIGREEAAHLLNCKPLAVGRRVKPVSPGTWSLIHIRKYMELMRQK